jgi:hypothetical protein
LDPIGVGPRFREHPLDVLVGLHKEPLDLVVKGLHDLDDVVRYGGVAGLARRVFGGRYRLLPGVHIDFQRVEVLLDLDPVVAPSHHAEGWAIGLIPEARSGPPGQKLHHCSKDPPKTASAWLFLVVVPPRPEVHHDEDEEPR